MTVDSVSVLKSRHVLVVSDDEGGEAKYSHNSNNIGGKIYPLLSLRTINNDAKEHQQSYSIKNSNHHEDGNKNSKSVASRLKKVMNVNNKK